MDEVVEIDDEIAELLPRFAANRLAEFDELSCALEREAFGELARRGHRLKGSGGCFGFMGLAAIGRAIEVAGVNSDPDAARAALSGLRAYLDEVRVRIWGELLSMTELAAR